MNKYKFLLLFIACCALPLLLAKMVLELGWFNSGASSKGAWQQSEIFLLEPSSEKAHWRLALAPKNECDKHCEQALFTIQQLYVGLGRKQEHVQPVFLSNASVPHQFNVFKNISATQDIPHSLRDKIMLIDAQGLVLLTYEISENENTLASTAKAIRQDLLKLLNFDRTSV